MPSAGRTAAEALPSGAVVAVDFGNSGSLGGMKPAAHRRQQRLIVAETGGGGNGPAPVKIMSLIIRHGWRACRGGWPLSGNVHRRWQASIGPAGGIIIGSFRRRTP